MPRKIPTARRPAHAPPAARSRASGLDSDPDRRRQYNSSAWQKLRALKRSLSPLCEDCKARGHATPAELVHHEDETRDAGNPVLASIDRLTSLCRRCHARRHGA